MVVGYVDPGEVLASLFIYLVVAFFGLMLSYVVVRVGVRHAVADVLTSEYFKAKFPVSETARRHVKPQEFGPGLYRIDGVDRQTKRETTWRVKAESADNARAKGELEGIIVTAVVREAGVQQAPAAIVQSAR